MRIDDPMKKPTFWYEKERPPFFNREKERPSFFNREKERPPFFDRKKDLSSDIRHNPYKDLNEINQSELFQPQVTHRPIRQVVTCPLHKADIPPTVCRACHYYSAYSNLRGDNTLDILEIREMGRTIPCTYQPSKIKLRPFP